MAPPERGVTRGVGNGAAKSDVVDCPSQFPIQITVEMSARITRIDGGGMGSYRTPRRAGRQICLVAKKKALMTGGRQGLGCSLRFN